MTGAITEKQQQQQKIKQTNKQKKHSVLLCIIRNIIAHFAETLKLLNVSIYRKLLYRNIVMAL